MVTMISVSVYSFPSGSLGCPNVLVNILGPTGNFLFNAVTDASGVANIALNPAQDVTGYQVIVEGSQIKGVGTRLKSDGTARLYTQLVTTQPMLEIFVTAYDGGTRDMNNHPIPGTQPIFGATVTVFTSGGSQRFTGLTDSTGTCRFTGPGVTGDDVTQWYATVYLPGQSLSNQVGAQLIPVGTSTTAAQCQIDVRP
jgi:hypothetical protein